ncbi:MAG: SLBB domain-containing protein [Planctomycetes bacterium]|nr:SLBB domain-containing protein [Planctomycetota bacterium]
MSKLGKRVGPLACFGLILLGTVGCSSLGESIGLSTPTNPLLKDAKAIRDAAPVPAPGGRELAKELLPTHVVEPGDTLLVQPVELDAPVRLPPDQPVQPDGTIDLGAYGRPVVAGKTLPQIEAQIKDVIKAHDKGKDFPVTVRLLGRPGKVYYVLGEVNAPGAFPLTGRETVLDGIVAAGGVTRRASLGNIVLSRPTVPDSCRIVYPVCYQQITQLGDTTTNYQLQPGDRVFVPSKGTLEGLLPQKCSHPAAACSRPQVPCFGGACVPGGPGTVTIPTAPTP